MDLNPLDDIADEVGKRKNQLVKYIKGKTGSSGPSIASGQTNRRPKYYRGGKRHPFRRP